LYMQEKVGNILNENIFAVNRKRKKLKT